MFLLNHTLTFLRRYEVPQRSSARRRSRAGLLPIRHSASALLVLLTVAGLAGALTAAGGDHAAGNAEKRDRGGFVAGQTAKKPAGGVADSASVGKQLYAKHCESCHGESGHGDGPAAKALEREPGNLADPQLIKKSDYVLFSQITKGKKPMPSYDKKLTEQERWAIVHYVRSLSVNK